MNCSVPVVLVGNKTDLHQERAVSAEEGRKLAESWRANFLETSAKQNEVFTVHLVLSFSNMISPNRFMIDITYQFDYFQSVADIFHSLLIQVERENGNTQEKSSCSIS